MNVKVVIFDWDGTLIDSVDHIADSLHQAATELGYPELEREAYRDIIGLGMIEALEKLYPGLSREEMNSIREGYAGYFFQQGDHAPECVRRDGRCGCRSPGFRAQLFCGDRQESARAGFCPDLQWPWRAFRYHPVCG